MRRNTLSFMMSAVLFTLAGCGSHTPPTGVDGARLSVAPASSGALLLQIGSARRYKVAYMAADIASMKVNVNNSAGAVLYTNTYSSNVVQIASGKVSISNLPVGEGVTVMVEAFDAQGATIGTAKSEAVAIAANATTAVAVDLQLADTPAPPAASPGPVGNLDVTTRVRDGKTLPAPPPIPAPVPSDGGYAPLPAEASPAPEVSPSPVATAAPEVTPAPEGSPAPEASPSPATSPAPEVTPTPEGTTAPEATPTPADMPSTEPTPVPTESPVTGGLIGFGSVVIK